MLFRSPNQICQILLKSNHFFLCVYACVSAISLGRDGFKRVAAVVGLQRLNQLRRVRAQLPSGQGPGVVACVVKFLHVNRLMGSMKRTQPKVKHAVR